MNEEQIRKDFEDWVSAGGLNQNVIDRSLLGDYSLIKVSCAWEAWKAAHTHYAKSAAPVVLPPHPDTARLQQAVWRLEDILKDDDGQAWKEARKFLEQVKKEQRQELESQVSDTDRLDFLIKKHLAVKNNDEAYYLEGRCQGHYISTEAIHTKARDAIDAALRMPNRN